MKRSLSINGHPTSVSLEDEFWHALRRIAQEDGVPLAALVARVDVERWQAPNPRGLSSALRVHVLRRLEADQPGRSPDAVASRTGVSAAGDRAAGD